jgi:hypothetical protein
MRRLLRNENNLNDLVTLYALVGRTRLNGSNAMVSMAEDVVKRIVA